MTYIEEAVKTESLSVSVENSRLLHAAMGISSEVAELQWAITIFDNENIFEEAGDIFWYCALACHEWDIETFGNLIEQFGAEDITRLAPEDALLTCSGELLDHMKKVTFYNKEPDHEKMKHLVANLVMTLSDFVEESGWNSWDVLDGNIRKLRARYGEAFSEDAAENRDTVAEMGAMNASS